jgi:hypothetical protein
MTARVVDCSITVRAECTSKMEVGAWKAQAIGCYLLRCPTKSRGAQAKHETNSQAHAARFLLVLLVLGPVCVSQEQEEGPEL